MKIIAVVSVIIVVTIVGFAGRYWYDTEQQKIQAIPTQEPSNVTLLSPSDSTSDRAKLIEKSTKDVMDNAWRGVALGLTEGEDLTEVDDKWLQYTNEDLGFSINVPKLVMSHGGGKCGQLSPLEFFTYQKGVDTVVKLAPKFIWKNDNGACRKLDNTLKNVTQKRDGTKWLEDTSWHITVAQVNNDIDLDKFVKYQYGKSCAIKEKKESAQSGVHDIIVYDQSGKGMISGDCALNFQHVMKYSPVSKKAVQWNLGQDVNFVGKGDISMGYDMDMVKSFKFLQGE